MSEFNIYAEDRTNAKPLPKYKSYLDDQKSGEEGDDKVEYYEADPGLVNAVNVAIALGQPLLLTGEPGTGKTKLAASIANQLKLGPPLIFNTKSTSAAQDLYYDYDALGHFQSTQISGSKGVEIDTDSATSEELAAKRRKVYGPYIKYQALGKAILMANEPQRANEFLAKEDHITEAHRSVVLIDEIDKAPRDLPNDILYELENMSFRIKELDETISTTAENRPILILTSNEENNLPKPFLRRCVYYHIDFPDDARLARIVNNKVQGDLSKDLITAAIKHFHEIRDLKTQKRPATAELLAWVHILNKLQINVVNGELEKGETLIASYPVLAKHQEDIKTLVTAIQNR